MVFEKKWGGTKILTKNSKSKNGNKCYKNMDRVMFSCLLMEIMMMKKVLLVSKQYLK